MKFKQFLTLAILVMVSIPLIITGIFSVTTNINSRISLLLEHEKQIVETAQTGILSFLDHSESEVLFLSELSSITQLINTNTTDSKLDAIKDLQDDFISFSHQNPHYYQMRYIDENGDEIVRIDNDGKTSLIIPESELQNKGDRYYFNDTISARKGVVFVSALDLNIEHGLVENRGTFKNPRYVPMIRYATPVFDSELNPKGIVITNIYAEGFLQKIQDMNIEGRSVLLINNDGYYLSHPNKLKTWGFMLDKEENFRTDFGVDFCSSNSINTDDDLLFTFLDYSNSVYDLLPLFKKGDYILHSHIWPSGDISISNSESNEAYTCEISSTQGYDYSWTVITVLSSDFVIAPAIILIKQSMIIAFFTLIVVGFSSMYISKKVTEPIEKLIIAAKDVASGVFRKKIKFKSNDEINELIFAFNEMANKINIFQKEIHENEINLTSEVKIRTQELEVQNQKSLKKAKTLENMRDATLNILEDVDESRKIIEESEVKYRALAENTPDAIMLFGLMSNLEFINASGLKFLHAKNIKVAKNLSILSHLSEPDQKKYRTAFYSCKRGKRSTLEFTYLSKNKPRVYLATLSSVKGHNGKIKYILFVGRDITDMKEIDVMKDELISLASHDLKTPVIAINGYSKMLLDGDFGHVTKAQDEKLLRIWKNSNDLMSIIEAMLDVSRLEGGRMSYDYKTFDLLESFTNSVRTVETLAQRKNVKILLKGKGKFPIEADEARITQIINNVLTNAVKYGKSGGHIWTTLEKIGHNYLLTFKDDGIGISKPDLSKIFDKMYQVDLQHRGSSGGVGFGLYLSKRIIEEGHKGKISVESEEGKGSKFQITLPIIRKKSKK